MQSLPPALAGLAPYPFFLTYRVVPSETRPGKTDKKPCNVRLGHGCDPTDQAHRGSFEEAAATVAAGRADGVGFVLTDLDPFWFLDIDEALIDGRWNDVAQDLLNRTAGAAVEVSRSGRGLHIIGSGALPPHGCKGAGGLELYHRDRLIALTGTHASGSVDWDGTHALPSIIAQYFPHSAGKGDWADWTDGPVPEWDGHENDDALIAHACRPRGSAAAAFGSAPRASFADLWNCDVDALARAYETPGRPYDASKADAALAQHLAFWTGNDCTRMERLMRQSGLARDKWDLHATYMYLTVMSACSRQKEWHRITRAAAPALDAITEGELLSGGYRILDPTQQLDLFRGCAYVRDAHQVFVPDGGMLKPEQFKVAFGGYSFVMDTMGSGGKVTRNAWEAFTESQAVRFPRVARTMFRPDLQPGLVFEREGALLVNNYVPIRTARKVGDVTPFLDHLRRLLPVEQDRQILLAYMAAVIQHKGRKFQWWPLVQGVQGNGKTLLSLCVAAAVGMQHVSTPKAEEVSNKFNNWIKDKIFVYLEDVYYPEHKSEILESLKPLVTNYWLPVEPKGRDSATAYVVANGMLNSNHRDAIRVTDEDRRFAIFFTAQQSKADLERDGMGGDYFRRLYHWLESEDGYAIVAQWLESYAIPDELNPAGACHRAPETSTSHQAIAESLGVVEQEIQEAIDQGRPGFAGGWVSSIALTKLLDGLKMSRAIPLRKRRAVMMTLGYDWHKGLRQGRVDNTVAFDGGKPRLFIRNGHIHGNLTTQPEIIRHYTEAQQPDAKSHWAVDMGVSKG